MNYVDGFILPIAKNRLAEYHSIVEKVAAIWKEHGALEYWECVGDDLGTEKGVRSLVEMTNATEAEHDVVARHGARQHFGYGFRIIRQIHAPGYGQTARTSTFDRFWKMSILPLAGENLVADDQQTDLDWIKSHGLYRDTGVVLSNNGRVKDSISIWHM